MPDPLAAAPPESIVIDSAAGETVGAQLRQAFPAVPAGAVILDLRRVAAVDPDFLRALQARLDVGRDIILADVSPEVYKALHVAGLANRVRRA